MWPPEDKAKGQPRKAVKAVVPVYQLDAADGPSKHVARFKGLRDGQAAEAKAKATKKSATTVDDLLDGAKAGGGTTDPLDVTAEAKAGDPQDRPRRRPVQGSSVLRQGTRRAS